MNIRKYLIVLAVLMLALLPAACGAPEEPLSLIHISEPTRPY